MTTINFFTPVHYGNLVRTTQDSVLEVVDDYFYLAGKKGCVLSNSITLSKELVILSDGYCSFFKKTLKVASYFTIILPLIALVVKTALRLNHQFYRIDGKTELEKNIQIPSNIVLKIQQLMPSIKELKDSSFIEWLSKSHLAVFRLTDDPRFVFKIAIGETPDATQIRNRFANSIQAKEICIAHQLDLLTIPSAKMVDISWEGKTYPILVEQFLNINSTQSAQEENYRKQEKNLRETCRQIAIFITQTGLHNITCKNLPIINEPIDYKGERKVGLLDLKHMEQAKIGVLGNSQGTGGLIRCLFSEIQIDTVLKEAKKHNLINEQEFYISKINRLQEISTNERLFQYYERNGIVNNERKQLKVDLKTLDLTESEVLEDLESEKQTKKDGWGCWNRFLSVDRVPLTKEAITKTTITEINRLIQTSSSNESLKGKRLIIINPNSASFSDYQKRIGIQKLTTCIQEIINALILKGHVFELLRADIQGFFIQA